MSTKRMRITRTRRSIDTSSPIMPGGEDHGHAQSADDDGDVVWLDTASVHQATFHFAAPQNLSRESFELMSPASEWIATLDYDTAPPHGPPRASPSLRGPPRLSA
jgi:hypothetical protein